MSIPSVAYYPVLIALCALITTTSGQHVSSTFLGPREISQDTPKESPLPAEQMNRISSHILSMKGLLPSLDMNSVPLNGEGLFDHPSLLNISLLMVFIFIAIVSVISGTAGLVLFVNSASIRKVDSRNHQSVNPLDTIEKSNSNTILSHPGCVRIVGKDSNDAIYQTGAKNSFFVCRE